MTKTKELSHILEHGSLTIQDFEGLCPDINRRTLQRDLKAMVDQGLIVSEGKTHQLRYRLADGFNLCDRFTTIFATCLRQPYPLMLKTMFLWCDIFQEYFNQLRVEFFTACCFESFQPSLSLAFSQGQVIKRYC